MADPLDNLIDSILGRSGPTDSGESMRAPDAMYDAQGRYFEYINGEWVHTPQFDDPTQAVGYQAPKSYAPRYPTTEITPTGDIFTIDPYSGMPTYMGNDPRLATGFSPSQQRANALEDFRLNRDLEFDLLDRTQGFTSRENQLDRDFTKSENSLDRALQAADLANAINYQNQQMAFQAEQAYQQQLRQFTQDKLAAAQQVADNISNVDPGALPAFYEAGGGVIANALAAGATGRSDLSDFGSARALRTSEEMVAPTRFEFTPLQFDPAMFFDLFGVPSQEAAPSAPSQGRTRREAIPSIGQRSSDGGVVTRSNPQNRGRGGVISTTKYDPETFTGFGNPFERTYMAGGGATNLPMVITGDHPQGRPNEEAVINPTGAPLIVVPLSKMGEQGRALSRHAPRAATGGLFTGTEGIEITDADRPYLDRIGEIRDNVEYPQLNPFDVGFALQAPSQIGRFFAGRQTRYAIPVEDQAFEAQRFALPGISRGSLSLGV